MKKMDNFKNCLQEYKIIITTTSGCGNRRQMCIDNTYKKLKVAFEKLSKEDKKDVLYAK